MHFMLMIRRFIYFVGQFIWIIEKMLASFIYLFFIFYLFFIYFLFIFYFIFLNNSVLSVADGVGGWAEYGIDPSFYSRSLCKKYN